MRNLVRPLLLGAALLSVPAVAAPRDTPEMRLEKMLAGRVAGTPVDCIDLGSATSSTIIDGKAIVYRAGGTLYVNTPRSYPQSLCSDDVLIMRTFGAQLCSTNVVQTADRVSGFPRSPIFLGKFVPYARPKSAAG